MGAPGLLGGRRLWGGGRGRVPGLWGGASGACGHLLPVHVGVHGVALVVALEPQEERAELKLSRHHHRRLDEGARHRAELELCGEWGQHRRQYQTAFTAHRSAHKLTAHLKISLRMSHCATFKLRKILLRMSKSHCVSVCQRSICASFQLRTNLRILKCHCASFCASQWEHPSHKGEYIGLCGGTKISSNEFSTFGKTTTRILAPSRVETVTSNPTGESTQFSWNTH